MYDALVWIFVNYGTKRLEMKHFEREIQVPPLYYENNPSVVIDDQEFKIPDESVAWDQENQKYLISLGDIDMMHLEEKQVNEMFKNWNEIL